MIERRRNMPPVLVPVLALAACAAQPGETSLVRSFAEQIAAVDGVTDFRRDGDELTFTGPDGRDGVASWRVRIESAELVLVAERPTEGHVVSSWFRDGEQVETIGSMYTLPMEFFDTGIAQECYALWNPASNEWYW